MKLPVPRQQWLTTALAAVALLAAPAWASAAPMHFMANFTPLNDSGVSGMASLMLDDNMLTVHITATGLAVGMSHPQHIHGTFDSSGNPTNATTPTSAVDANHDGVIELGEGATTYGAILVPLAPFPTAPDGTIDFTHVYDLTNSDIYADGFGKADLFPLTYREIVLHGMVTPVDIDDNLLGLSFSAGEYDPVLPVASAVITPAVSEPSAFGLGLAGLGLVFGLLWLRREDSREKA